MFYGQSLKLLNPQFWRKVRITDVQLPAQDSKRLNTHLTPLLVVTMMYKLSTSLPFFIAATPLFYANTFLLFTFKRLHLKSITYFSLLLF